MPYVPAEHDGHGDRSRDLRRVGRRRDRSRAALRPAWRADSRVSTFEARSRGCGRVVTRGRGSRRRNHESQPQGRGRRGTIRASRCRKGHRSARDRQGASSLPQRRPPLRSASDLEVVAFVEPEGWLVTRFISGEIPPVERRRDPAMLARVAAALRAFHDGPSMPGAFDSFRVVDVYCQTALDRGGSIPDEFGWANEIAGGIEARRSAETPSPVPQRSPRRKLPRRRRAPTNRRLGVRGHGRSVLRPRELLDQP